MLFHYRLMDKYARLMQKLEIVNVEFFRVNLFLLTFFFYCLCSFIFLSVCLLLIQFG